MSFNCSGWWICHCDPEKHEFFYQKSIGEAGEAVRTISHETTDTVLTINETAEYLANYALMIGETVKTIATMFSSNKKE